MLLPQGWRDRKGSRGRFLHEAGSSGRADVMFVWALG